MTVFKVYKEPSAEASAEVAALPRRAAHATHALLVAWLQINGPVKTSEVLTYDEESLSVGQTHSALRTAAKHSLVAFTGQYWIARERAHELKRALEDRYLAEVYKGEREMSRTWTGEVRSGAAEMQRLRDCRIGYDGQGSAYSVFWYDEDVEIRRVDGFASVREASEAVPFLTVEAILERIAEDEADIPLGELPGDPGFER